MRTPGSLLAVSIGARNVSAGTCTVSEGVRMVSLGAGIVSLAGCWAPAPDAAAAAMSDTDNAHRCRPLTGEQQLRRRKSHHRLPFAGPESRLPESTVAAGSQSDEP